MIYFLLFLLFLVMIINPFFKVWSWPEQDGTNFVDNNVYEKEDISWIE